MDQETNNIPPTNLSEIEEDITQKKLFPTTINCALTSATVTSSVPSPKKSARLAEKRKLREEAGGTSLFDEDFYFTPYKSCRSSPITTKSEKNSQIVSNSTVSSTFIPISEPSENPESAKSSEELSCSNVNVPGDSEMMTQEAEASSEEEKWFDAIDIEKADYENISDKTLTEDHKPLASGSEENVCVKLVDPPTLAKDMVRARLEKCEKRRILARQKKEYDKKKTVDRLLKKSQIKIPKIQTKKLGPKITEPMITYVIGKHVNTISFPVGLDITVFGDIHVSSPESKSRSLEPILCGVEGCSNTKKYTCSKTCIPICSLECYKKNLRIRNQENSETILQ